MTYTPTVWATGDVITAVKLNKAEQGIASNSNIVYVANAEVGDDGPVITQGDFDDACAVIEAGGIVVLALSSEGVGTSQYFSCQYYPSEHAAIDLFTISNLSGLKLGGIEWSASGLAQWPLS